MANMINITIDGKQCTAKEGDFILNVARANDIFVPAICYQTKCSPTLACRLCLVEADGKQVYACNAKSKDGMNITTTTPNIQKERRAIMEVYDVNHPLQCGVCDKSGECELQNYTLLMNVDQQNYAVRDVNRPTANWGVMNYDPGLCIVCEKCVTVCKDMIGSNALSTVKRGADALDKEYKANMPKDAYAMWNKLNKNLIGFDKDSCIDCGECIEVCPVGAMVSSDFQYKSNAWELEKIPAANPYSSDCTFLYYEVKHTSIEKNTTKTIYRVTNESHYSSLSGAARFGFDYSNKAKKDNVEFLKAVDALKTADTILFNSYITNEEALILQKIKEKTGAKLVNNDAKRYKEFLDTYSKVTGKAYYNGTLNSVHNSKFIVSIGSYLKSDAPSVKYAFNNAITINKAIGIYFHPLDDKHIAAFGKKGKNIETVVVNPHSEEALLYFILDQFGANLPQNIKEFLDSKKETRTKIITETIKEKVTSIVVDKETGEEKEVTKVVPKKVKKEVEYIHSTLLDGAGASEDFVALFETMALAAQGINLIEHCDDTTCEMFPQKSDDYVLIIGEDCITHKNSKNIARLIALVEKHTQFKVIIPPTKTNTLGVGLICELDDEISGKTVGYNVEADYQLSALGDGNLDMPTLNQQEGTFVNIDARVVPTNAALPYDGYTLNDIANEILDSKKENTIDYTAELFKKIAFDDLDNYYANDWTEHRGYLLDHDEILREAYTLSFDIDKLEAKENEYIIYNANPINQFNEFTAVATQLKNDIVAVYLSQSLKDELELDDNSKLEVSANGTTMILDVRVDLSLEGQIAYVSTFDKHIKTDKLFGTSRYSVANLRKV
jgi:NADH-quinone oxidoreductase subunit G